MKKKIQQNKPHTFAYAYAHTRTHPPTYLFFFVIHDSIRDKKKPGLGSLIVMATVLPPFRRDTPLEEAKRRKKNM